MRKNDLPYTPVDLPNKHFAIGSSVITKVEGKEVVGTIVAEYPYIVTIKLQDTGYLLGIPKQTFLCGDAIIQPTIL